MIRFRIFRAASAAVILPIVALAVGAVIPASAAGPAAETTLVYDSDLGTVNYDGGGEWSVSSPSGTGWDQVTPGGLFTGHPTDGGKWTLDIEGKAPGTTTPTPNGGVSFTTVGYSNGDPTLWAQSQKVRYEYFLGSGGYPALDAQLSSGVITVSTFFSQEFSWRASYVEDADATVHGVPTLDLRIQDPVTQQRVSLHSNGLGAPQLTGVPSSIVVSDPAHSWVINSTVGSYSQYSSLTTSALTTDFAGWDVVSFGPNSGRGADGVLNLSSITVLGNTFAFVGAKPATTPAVVPETTPPVAGFDGDLADQASHDVVLDVGEQYAGQWVGLTIHSTPQFLGYYLVDGRGIVTLTLPSSVPAGAHSIAVYDAVGVFQGWISGISIAALLPSTGVAIGPVLSVALVAILLGAGLYFGSLRYRTRRRH